MRKEIIDTSVYICQVKVLSKTVYKIGFSTDIPARMATLHGKLIMAKMFSRMRARALESSLHSLCCRYRVQVKFPNGENNKEIYDLPPEEVIKIITFITEN